MSTDESLLHGRYKLINTLGHGGMCKVYLAEDTQNPEQPDCVVKTLKPALQDPQQLKTAKNLFQRGATALAKLGDHPQIPRLLDFFEEDDEFYTVEEFIQGHALTLEMQPGERWTEANVIDLLQEILPILEFIHGQNIIHRDIKPDNILRRDKDNQLVLIDFGAVRQINVQPTTTVGPGRTGTIVGTYGYMPTEQGHGNPRPNSDIYALGILCIQALTGLLPSQLLQDPQTGEVRWQGFVPVSPDLANILNKMVRYHFKDRYQSAAEVLRSIKTLSRKRESVEPREAQPSTHLNLSIPNPLVSLQPMLTSIGRSTTGLLQQPKRAIRPLFLAGLGTFAVLGAFWGVRAITSPPKATFGGDKILTVGIVNTRTSPRQDYNNLTNYLREQIQAKYGKDVQVKFEFVERPPQGASQTASSQASAVARQAVESKTWELAFTGNAGVSSVAFTNNYQFVARMFPERTETRSVFFVREDSPIRSLEDITNRTTIAMGDFTNASSFFMPVYDLYGKSISLNRGNREIHQIVTQGRADVGVGSERRIKELMEKEGKLRIIHTSRALPTSGVYLAPTLTSQERKELSQILLSAPAALQQQAHYGAGPRIDYTEYLQIAQRVEEVTSCTNWPEPQVTQVVNLFCRSIVGTTQGYDANDNSVNFNLQAEDGKAYRLVLSRSVMRQDPNLSAPGAINFKRVAIKNVQPVVVNGVSELRITQLGQMTLAAR
jgi:serine/threonine protein kinase